MVFTVRRLVAVVLIAGILFVAIAIIGPTKSVVGAYMERNATVRSWDVSIRDAVRSSPAGDQLVAMGYLQNGPQAAISKTPAAISKTPAAVSKASSAKPAGR
jgi:hypothetical protein